MKANVTYRELHLSWVYLPHMFSEVVLPFVFADTPRKLAIKPHILVSRVVAPPDVCFVMLLVI